MFNVGGGELLVIAVLALIVLGPDKLPQAARQAGKIMSEIRGISNGFRQELKSALDEADVNASEQPTPEPPTPAVDSDADAAIEARARERGRQLTSPPEGATPIGDQPVTTEPVAPPETPGANGTNGANGNGPRAAPDAS